MVEMYISAGVLSSWLWVSVYQQRFGGERLGLLDWEKMYRYLTSTALM